jgi:hypothetical protein
VGDGLDLEGAAVGNKVDTECAGVLLAGARDQDVHVGGESRVGVVLKNELVLQSQCQDLCVIIPPRP